MKVHYVFTIVLPQCFLTFFPPRNQKCLWNLLLQCIFLGEPLTPIFVYFFNKEREGGLSIYIVRDHRLTDATCVVKTFQLSLINSFNHYFDGIIQPVPFRDFPLLHLVFLNVIYLATCQYGNHSFYLIYFTRLNPRFADLEHL